MAAEGLWPVESRGSIVETRTPLRFRWSHTHPVHRQVVQRANRVLAKVPLTWKYAAGQRLRRGRPPYALVGPGDVVVQVGAPSDTLLSGRSRGMHLALRTVGGRAIIVEPDPDSADTFRRCAAELGLDHVTVVNSGAWNEPATLQLLVDPAHPATNFVAGTVAYAPERIAEFTPVDVPVDTLDDIVERVLGNHGPVRLVSITTNNSEREIMQGLKAIVDADLQYLCLARTGEGYDELVADLGFDFLHSDDRGYTYVRRRA